jgi:hypothetical protein
MMMARYVFSIMGYYLIFNGLLFLDSVYALTEYGGDDKSENLSQNNVNENMTLSKIKNPESKKNESIIKPQFDLSYSKMRNSPFYNKGGERYDLEIQSKVMIDVDMKLSYWIGNHLRMVGVEEKETKDFQLGNVSLFVGVDWLKIGEQDYFTILNIYSGTILPEKKSLLASSRQDYVIGVKTTKKIHQMVLFIQGERRFSTKSKKEEEWDVGGASIFSLGVGGIISNDIRVSSGINYGKIESKKRSEKTIDQPLEYLSSLTELGLGVKKNVDLVLGMNILIKKPQSEQQDDLRNVNFMNYPGVMGDMLVLRLSLRT